jgi:hypothetical protein
MFIFYNRFNLYSYLQIDDVVQMYETKEPFTIMHWKKKLRNEAKWNNKFLDLNNSTSPDGMSSPSTQGCTVVGHAESGNENIDTSRPEGRDSAKRRRSKSLTKTASSRTAVEVLLRLQEKSDKMNRSKTSKWPKSLAGMMKKLKFKWIFSTFRISI